MRLLLNSLAVQRLLIVLGALIQADSQNKYKSLLRQRRLELFLKGESKALENKDFHPVKPLCTMYTRS